MQGITEQPQKNGSYGYDKPWTAEQIGAVTLFWIMFIVILGPALWGLFSESVPDSTADHELCDGRP